MHVFYNLYLFILQSTLCLEGSCNFTVKMTFEGMWLLSPGQLTIKNEFLGSQNIGLWR